MKQIKIKKTGLKVEKNSYPFFEIDNRTLLDRKVKDRSGNELPNTAGVYIFISDRDFPNFNINYFNSEVTGVFIGRYKPLIKVMEVPPFNKKPKRNCVFYVGSDASVISRIKEHWKRDKLNGCTSLKLGFSSRKWIKQFLKVYVITSCADKSKILDYKQLEKDIRNEYGAAFGK